MFVHKNVEFGLKMNNVPQSRRESISRGLVGIDTDVGLSVR